MKIIHFQYTVKRPPTLFRGNSPHILPTPDLGILPPHVQRRLWYLFFRFSTAPCWEKSLNSRHPLAVHLKIRVMWREQKKENFWFQPENKTQFTQVFGERFFKLWSSFEYKSIWQNTFWLVYFWLQKLIFAVFAFICGLRNFKQLQKTLLFALVLSCFEGLMVLKEYSLVVVSQTVVSFLKEFFVFQKIGN